MLGISLGQKKDKEPRHINSPLNNPMLNYRTYAMGKAEAVAVRVGFFLLGGVVGLTFYAGLFKVDGYPTTATYLADLFFFVAVGLVAEVVFVPIYCQSRLEKRGQVLSRQFRDLLEALTSSFATGANTQQAFEDALEDVRRQYDPDDFVVREVQEIVDGSHQGFAADVMLRDFADRSGDEDIQSFADVFEACYRSGGSMTSIIQRTRTVIVDKAAVADEVQTKLTSNKLQHNVMSVMPIVVMLMLRLTNESFAQSFATPTGVGMSTVAIAMFVGSYVYGRKIVDVRV